MKQRGEEYFVPNNVRYIRKSDYISADVFSMEGGVDQIIGVTARLQKAVDVSALQKAAHTTLFVHPSFRECRYAQDGELYEYYSEEPPTVFCDEGTLDRGVLCSGKINPYQFRVSYEKHEIHLLLSHSLTDGRGTLKYFNTLIYYYLLYAGENVMSDASVTTLETPFDKAELEPAQKSMRSACAYNGKSKSLKNMLMPYTTFAHDERPYQRSELRFPLSALMRLSRSTESSPVSVLLPFYAQALLHLCDNPHELPIVFSSMLDLRQIFNPASMRNSSSTVNVDYYPKMTAMPLERQSTMVRGQIDLALSFPEYLPSDFDARASLAAMPLLAQLGKRDERLYFAPFISNIGKINMSESMAQRIDDIRVDGLMPMLGCYTGITTFKNEVCMFFDHRFPNELVIDTVLEIMKENGIAAVKHSLGEQRPAIYALEK